MVKYICIYFVFAFDLLWHGRDLLHGHFTITGWLHIYRNWVMDIYRDNWNLWDANTHTGHNVTKSRYLLHECVLLYRRIFRKMITQACHHLRQLGLRDLEIFWRTSEYANLGYSGNHCTEGQEISIVIWEMGSTTQTDSWCPFLPWVCPQD